MSLRKTQSHGRIGEAAVPSTGAAGTRCRWYGCASAAGGWGDDHHTAAARVRAAPRAACSGAHASGQGTANTQLFGLAR